MNGCLAASFVLACTLSLSPGGKFLASDELADIALVANRAATESIQSLSCRVERRLAFPRRAERVEVSHAQYWYSSGSVRCQEGLPGSSTSYVLTISDGSVSRALNFANGVAGTASFKDARGHILRHDARLLGLLECHVGSAGPDGRRMSVAELISASQRRNRAERVTRAERELICITTELDHPNERLARRYEFYFDPAVNYLLAELVEEQVGGGRLTARSIVQSFAEPTPGCYFPTHVEIEITKGNEPVSRSTVRFSDIQVNAPIRPELFEFACPRETLVHDFVTMTSYRADEHGKPMGQAAPLRRVVPPPPADSTRSGSGHSSAAPVPIGTASIAEEPSAWRWLFAGCFLLVCSAMGASLWRRWRARHGAKS